MRLENYLKEESDKKIFLDMDGVIVDFIASVNKMFNIKDFKEWESKKTSEKWNKISQKGKPFWSEMAWTKDGKKLWNYLKGEDVTILSAHPKDKGESEEGKRSWLSKNIGSSYASNAIILLGIDKQKHADKNHILIDDSERNIRQWKNKGGIGIVHKNTSSTIKQLEGLI